MDKLELMAFMLPTGFHVIDMDESLIKNNIEHVSFNSFRTINEVEKRKSYKLILRPLSGLTKEIEHKGEKFIPMIKLAELKVIKGLYKDIAPSFSFDCKIVKKPFGLLAKCTKLDQWVITISLYEPEKADFWIIKKLIEWHFDICGLIEKDEAIDYHTLPDFVS